MDRKQIILLAALVVILVVLAILFNNQQPRFNWNENYKQDSKEPYGTQVISDLLQSYFPSQSFQELNDSIPDNFPEGKVNANYVFIGPALYIDSMDVQGLLSFVEKGNTALISSKTIPFDLMFYLYYEECNDYYWDEYSLVMDTVMEWNLLHDNLRAVNSFEYKFIYRNKVKKYNWHYIDESYFCEEEYSLTALGRMRDSLINFARIKYGAGYFYLHTSPIAFTNIQLLDETGLDYANRIFSHLSEGDIYWDNYSRVSEAIGRRQNEQVSMPDSNRRLSSKGPLQYILEQPPLAWAWYITLFTSLLYLIFRSKRRQRVIPVMERNSNTSMEFISTISQLYFLQNNHRKLALQKINLFKSFVWRRYGLQTKEINEEYIKKLTARSEVDGALVQKIFLLDKNISGSSFVSENTLMDFHKLIDQFYKTCK